MGTHLKALNEIFSELRLFWNWEGYGGWYEINQIGGVGCVARWRAAGSVGRHRRERVDAGATLIT